MILYRKLSQIGLLQKSYLLKFLFIAFIGIHIPLIGLIVFVIYFQEALSPSIIIGITLVLTLVATAATLYVLKALIDPIRLTVKALDNYRNKKTLPNLPGDFTDEAGILMAQVQLTILSNERLLIEKQDLIYHLTHDLKNFNENTMGLAHLIIDDKSSENGTKYAKMILDSVEKQTTFVSAFIEMMKEQDEIIRQKIHVKTIDLQQMVRNLQVELRQKLENKNMDLVVNIESNAARLKANEELLLRVLINLVENAIKFSFPENKIILTVAKQHARLLISVKDYGIGFDQKKSSELFKKFGSMSRPGTLGEKSHGIGLYLCRQIVNRFEGQLEAESLGEQKGAEFTISLKVYR